jgi:hypothetical protein
VTVIRPAEPRQTTKPGAALIRSQVAKPGDQTKVSRKTAIFGLQNGRSLPNSWKTDYRQQRDCRRWLGWLKSQDFRDRRPFG